MQEDKIKCPYGGACYGNSLECILFGKCSATRDKYPHVEVYDEEENSGICSEDQA